MILRKIKYKKGRKVIPSTMEYTGIHKDTQTEIQLYIYSDADIVEHKKVQVSEIEASIDLKKTNWLNLHGLNDTEIINALGTTFKIDNFILSDIMNTSRRTRLDEHHDMLFFSIKSILPEKNSDNINVEQISFVLKENVLISFQEKRGDFFTHIRERIRNHSGIVRTKKVDYLLYLLLDAVMENFYITLENEEDKIEKLISLSKISVKPKIIEDIERHRDNFNFLKRSIVPLRDSLFQIKNFKDDNVCYIVEEENYSFFSRLHQKSLELLDQIEGDMQSLDSASNFYFSLQSHKMNEIMKTLTILSGVFIPLTFIAGIYGMNFDIIPELKNPNGYFYTLGAMGIITIILLFYFKWRKWF